MSSANIKEFEAVLSRAAEEFKQIKRTQAVKLISNLDADGISAASIIVKMLERLNLSYSITMFFVTLALDS